MYHQLAKRNFSSYGFTLLEILIAIFILGLVLTTVYASYSSTLKVTRDIEYENGIYKIARISLDRMIKDLSSLQLSGDSFILRAEKNIIGKHKFDSLVFWSAAHLAFGENDISGNSATISYFVKEDEGGDSFSLWRADILGTKPSPEKNTDSGFVLCQNLESLNLKFYDASGKETDNWDSSSLSSEQKGKAPVAIKIELSLVNVNNEEKPFKFMTKVYLPAKR
jgi:general secretion pathway protein J